MFPTNLPTVPPIIISGGIDLVKKLVDHKTATDIARINADTLRTLGTLGIAGTVIIATTAILTKTRLGLNAKKDGFTLTTKPTRTKKR